MLSGVTIADGTKIHVRCIYFKESGKWYAEGEMDISVEDYVMKDVFSPKDVGRMLAREGKLPGLAGGTWSGPFVVDILGTYMELILEAARR